MMCKSAIDLTKFGGKLMNMNDEANAFFISVVQKHYAEQTCNNIWTIEKIDDYSCEQLGYNAFFSSKLFSLLNNSTFPADISKQSLYKCGLRIHPFGHFTFNAGCDIC